MLGTGTGPRIGSKLLTVSDGIADWQKESGCSQGLFFPILHPTPSYLFFFFSQFFFLFVVNFVIHWNEKALGSHVFPIPSYLILYCSLHPTALSPNYRPLANFPHKGQGGLIPRAGLCFATLGCLSVRTSVCPAARVNWFPFEDIPLPFLLLSSLDVCDQRQPQGLED